MAVAPWRWLITVFVCAIITWALCGAVAAQAATNGELVLLGEQEGSFTFIATVNVGPDTSAAAARFVFNYQDEQNHYELTLAEGRTQFRRMAGGEAVDIGRRGAVSLTSGEHLLSVQRRSWRMTLIWDSVVVCSAYDSAFSGGNVGYAVAGMDVGDAFVQVVPPVLWTDDFMRAGAATTPWESIAGTWQQKELRTEARREQDPSRSANAFCHYGRSDDGVALAIAGEAQQYWFWDDYSYSLAVKSSGGPVGAVFLYQDADNYLLFRCSSELDPEGPRTQLVSVVNGERTLLAEARGGIVPEYWYALRVNVSGGLIEAFVDDRPVLTARTDLFGQGQIGLYTEGEPGAYFDDVWVESWSVFMDDFAEREPGKWAPAGGDWEGPQKGTMAKSGGGEGLLISGDATWTNYVYGVDVKPSKGAGAGIAFRVGDAGKYVFRWAPRGSDLPYAGEAQLLRISHAEPAILASVPAKLAPAEVHRFKVACDGPHIALFVDEQRLIECADALLPGGAIGLYADGRSRVAFDNVSVRFPRGKRGAKIVPRFESPGDSTMQAWATKSGQWTAEKGRSGYWHVADFFGDNTISFEIAAVGRRSGSAAVTISRDPDDPGAAWRLVITTIRGRQTLKFALYHGEKCLQESQTDVPPGKNAEIRIQQKGNYILVHVNGQCILAHEMAL